jgi:hypothetical protein
MVGRHRDISLKHNGTNILKRHALGNNGVANRDAWHNFLPPLNSIGMSALGQKQTLVRVHMMSALPPKADIAE